MQTCAKAIRFNVALQYGFSNIIALDRGYSGIKNTSDDAVYDIYRWNKKIYRSFH